MKKRKFYVMSLIMTIILCVSSANVNAQVTIGSNDTPHPGAVLELKSEKGLLLSKVALQDANIFQLSSVEIAEGEGMIIYNTNPNMKDGQGTGLYVWDSKKWMAVMGGKSATVKGVIKISSPVNEVVLGDSIR